MDAGELLPDEIMLGIVDRAAGPAPTPATAASCSTASPARSARPRRSTRSSPSAARRGHRPRGARATWCSSACRSRRVCSGLRHQLLAGRAARATPWICDVCGGEVVQRDDDTAEAIGRRLDLYERETVPPSSYFEPARACSRASTGSARPTRCRPGSWPPSTATSRRLSDAVRARRVARRCARRTEVAKMRTAGQVVAEMHDRIRAAVRPGVTTARARRRRPRRDRAPGRDVELPRLPRLPGRDLRLAQRHRSCTASPAATGCEEGDIISIDCGAIVDGWHGDAAFTMGVGDDHARGARG